MDGRESMKHMVMIRGCQMAALFFTRATSQSPCLHETLATAAIT